ncbi:MAG: hypothetical protein GC150_07840 [Rhizobiales bacterium]|nr:hypothetical protein [Hyphomicrobiales bacterium]
MNSILAKSARLVACGALLAVMTGAAGAASVSEGTATTPSSQPAGSYQVAYACGWYAISVCSKGYNSAQKGANRYGGYVIHTSHPDYPNFRNGWYCAVVGPTSKSAAQGTARYMRSIGAHTAYAKNAC